MRIRLERELERVEAYRVQLEREARLAAELRTVRESYRPPTFPSLPAVGSSGQFTVPAIATDTRWSSDTVRIGARGGRARSAVQSLLFIAATSAAILGLSRVQWDRWPVASSSNTSAAAAVAPAAARPSPPPMTQCSAPAAAPAVVAPAPIAIPAPVAVAAPVVATPAPVTAAAKRAKGAARKAGASARTTGAPRPADAVAAVATPPADAAAQPTAVEAPAKVAPAEPARGADFDQAKRTAALLREQLAGSMP